MNSTLSTFKGKRVLVTGHTGFKGSWLCIWLQMLGAEVIGVALDPEIDQCIYNQSGIQEYIKDHRVDIRDREAVMAIFETEQPAIVFHLAAQPLVLESYQFPVETYETNVMGTAHILEAIRKTPSVKAAVMITTDKCYDNKEWYHGYRETDDMGGFDPYSSSKGAAEILIASYRNSFFLKPTQANIASARAGNVIGGGDWSANRIIPDVFRAVASGNSLEVRSPMAIRPWQHVLEPLYGYMLLALKLIGPHGSDFAEGWNFGPLPNQVTSVKELLREFYKHFPAHEWKDVSHKDAKHEAKILLLDINKAIFKLGWKPVLDLKQTVGLTSDWYLNSKNQNPLALSQAQIKTYMSYGNY